MRKRSLKSVALFLAVLLMFSCFVGCKNDKDVYGAASEFIKVNHPETPDNAFSDDGYVGSGTTSSKNNSSASSDASGGGSSGGSSTDASDVSDVSDVSGGGSSKTSTSSDTGLIDTPIDGDYGPVVIIP